MISSINKNISFGQTQVGLYPARKKGYDGRDRAIYIKISRFDNDADYYNSFDREKIKHIPLHNCFENKTYKDSNYVEYVAEEVQGGELLGMASCKLYGDNIVLKTIGTDNSCIGTGRALMAGIASDIKGKYHQLEIFNPLPKSKGFYTKCYCYGNGDILHLHERDFDKLISDAQRQL